MSYVFALVSSVLWGTADFIGGRASRRLSAWWVVVASQLCGFALLSIGSLVAVLLGVRADGAGWLGWGAASGVALAVGLGCFYRALAIGRMGVVAPVASTGVAVPVIVGLLEGDRPHLWQVIGMVVAIIGVILASRPPSNEPRESSSALPVVLALVAGVGFGAALVALRSGTESNGLYTLWVARFVIVALLFVLAWRNRPAAVTRADIGMVALLAVADVGANATYAVASTSGDLALTSVLSSLYPVVTTLLARQLLHERLARMQAAGVVATMAGTVLIVS